MTTAEEALKNMSLYTWPFHPQAAICPVCHKDCKHQPLAILLYVFEGCDCQGRLAPHLVEQLYHRGCYEARLLRKKA